MNYNNSGFASVFTIPFSLESGLSATDFVKVVFPFRLHTTEMNGLPVGLIARYSRAVGDFQCGNSEYLAADISINLVAGINEEPTAYYISFYDNLSQRINLDVKQYYYLQIEITGTSVNIQSPGIKSPLQVKFKYYKTNPSIKTFSLHLMHAPSLFKSEMDSFLQDILATLVGEP